MTRDAIEFETEMHRPGLQELWLWNLKEAEKNHEKNEEDVLISAIAGY